MLLNLLNAQNVAEGQSRFVGFGEVSLYALLGFATVFLGIAFLIFVVWVAGKILGKANTQVRAKKEIVSNKTQKDSESATNEAETVTQIVGETEEISEETIAIITAAIMAYYEKNNPKCEFTLKRIKRI